MKTAPDVSTADAVGTFAFGNPLSWALQTAIDIAPGILSGGPKGPNAAQQRALEAAGWIRNEQMLSRGRLVTWTRGAETIGNESARAVARQLVRNPSPVIGAGIAGPIVAPSPGGFGGPIEPGTLGEILQRDVGSGSGKYELDRLLRGVPELERLLRMPRVEVPPPIVGVGAGIAGAVAGALGVLWPSPIGPEEPVRTRRRPRAVGRPRSPPAPPKVPPLAAGPRPSPPKRTVPRPRTLGSVDRPRPPATRPTSIRNPLPAPRPGPILVDAPRLPATAPRSLALPDWVKFALPLLSPLLMPGRTTQPGINNLLEPLVSGVGTGPDTLSAFQPGQLLTGFESPGVRFSPQTSSSGDRCNCSKPSKPRGPKKCTNPIVSTRRDGNRIITTRELKCPVSSRKKRASPQAR